MDRRHAEALRKSRRRVNLAKHEVDCAMKRLGWARECYLKQPTPWRFRVVQEATSYLSVMVDSYLSELAIGIAVEHALRNA